MNQKFFVAMSNLKLAIRIYLLLVDVSTQLCIYLLKLPDIIDMLLVGTDPTSDTQDLSYIIMENIAKSISERLTQIINPTQLPMLPPDSITTLLVAQSQLSGCLELVGKGHEKNVAFSALLASVGSALTTMRKITGIPYPDISVLEQR